MPDETTPSGLSSRLGRLGAAQRTARQITLASTLAEHHEKWDQLDDKTKRRLEKTNFYLPLVLVVVASGSLLLLLSNFGGTTIHMVAQTEFVRYTPLLSDPPQWLISQATIREIRTGVDELPEGIFSATTKVDATVPNVRDNASSRRTAIEGDGSRAKVESVTEKAKFDGYFHPHCGDTITLTRSGESDLNITVKSVRQPVITPDINNKGKFELSDNAQTILITLDADALTEENPPLVWPMVGRIDPGRQIEVQQKRQDGVLIDGQIELLAGRFFNDSRFAIDQRDLEPGDHVVLPTSEDLDGIAKDIANEIAQSELTGDSDRGDACARFHASKQRLFSWFRGTTDENFDKGFVLAGGRYWPGPPRAMHVSLTSNASTVDIERYRSSPLRVEISWFKRLLSDPLVTLVWTAAGLALILHRRILRTCVVMLSEIRKREP